MLKSFGRVIRSTNNASFRSGSLLNSKVANSIQINSNNQSSLSNQTKNTSQLTNANTFSNSLSTSRSNHYFSTSSTTTKVILINNNNKNNNLFSMRNQSSTNFNSLFPMHKQNRSWFSTEEKKPQEQSKSEPTTNNAENSETATSKTTETTSTNTTSTSTTDPTTTTTTPTTTEETSTTIPPPPEPEKPDSTKGTAWDVPVETACVFRMQQSDLLQVLALHKKEMKRWYWLGGAALATIPFGLDIAGFLGFFTGYAFLNYFARPNQLLQLFVTEDNRVIYHAIKNRRFVWEEAPFSAARFQSGTDNTMRFLVILDRDIAMFDTQRLETSPESNALREFFSKGSLTEEAWQRILSHRYLFPNQPEELIRYCFDLESAGEIPTEPRPMPEGQKISIHENFPLRFKFTSIPRSSKWTTTFLQNFLGVVAKLHGFEEKLFSNIVTPEMWSTPKKILSLSYSQIETLLSGDKKAAKVLHYELGTYTIRAYIRSWRFWVGVIITGLLTALGVLVYLGLQEMEADKKRQKEQSGEQ